MKRFWVFIAMCAVLQGGNVVARGDVYTFQPGASATLWGLDHNWHYTWGLNWSAPNGEEVVRAVLSYVYVDDWKQPDTNRLYTHLLQDVSPPDGAMTATNWVISENNRRDKTDSFAGRGYALPEYTDIGPGKETISFEIPREYLSWLSGTFGLGIDPHCTYTNEGIVLTIETRAIVPQSPQLPVPGAALLGAIGLAFVGCARKHFAEEDQIRLRRA